MRRTMPSVALGLGLLAALWSCSKQSSGPPTAPPPPTPACALSATSLAFGSIAVGSTADRSFTLSNAGGGTLSGTVTEAAAEFALIGTTAYNLTAGQSQSFTLRFTPASAGAKACTLSTGGSLCGRVVATANATMPPPQCEVTPTHLDFGSVRYPSSTNRSVTIRNRGGGTLSGQLRLPRGDFKVIGDPAYALGPGGVASFFVEFAPSSGGAQRCTLQTGSTGCAVVTGMGLGTLETYGTCSVGVTSGDTLDFGQVSVGQTLARTVTVRNHSSTYSSEGTATSYCADFESNFALDFPPGGSGARTVRFTPSRAGVQYCAVQVGCWMNGSGTNPGITSYLILRGEGVGGTPACEVASTVIDFGSVAVGQSVERTVYVTNTGTGILAGSAGPSPCERFSFVGSTSYALSPGATAALIVRYSPSAAGVTTSCPLVPVGNGCATLTLVGEAVAASVPPGAPAPWRPMPR